MINDKTLTPIVEGRIIVELNGKLVAIKWDRHLLDGSVQGPWIYFIGKDELDRLSCCVEAKRREDIPRSEQTFTEDESKKLQEFGMEFATGILRKIANTKIGR